MFDKVRNTPLHIKDFELELYQMNYIRKIFLRIPQNFSEKLFYKKSVDNCLLKLGLREKTIAT